MINAIQVVILDGIFFQKFATLNMNELKYELKKLPDLMPDIWNFIKKYPVILLQGNLGAGKTTFTTHLCHFLKINEQASSPTFSLINEYTFEDNQVQKTLYHTDWYRINNIQEAIDAGLEDLFSQKNTFVIIEWGEKVKEILPSTFLEIHFEIINDQERLLKFIPQ